MRRSRSSDEKCYSCKRLKNLFASNYKIKTRRPSQVACRQRTLIAAEVIFTCKTEGQWIIILRLAVAYNRPQLIKISVPKKPKPVKISARKFLKIFDFCDKRKRTERVLNSRKEPIAEPIKELANEIVKNIPKSCKLADREIVVFIESADDDELFQRYIDAATSLKYLIFGDAGALSTKNVKWTVVKALTVSQVTRFKTDSDEKILAWTERSSLTIVDDLKAFFSQGTIFSKQLIAMTSELNTTYWHYIFLEDKVEIFSLSKADVLSLENRLVSISSPDQIADGTHQLLQELCDAPKVPTKIDVQEIVPAEVMDKTPEPVKIEKCTAENSISIFFDKISQEELSDFVQKIQQYLTGEVNGPFELTDSRVSEKNQGRRLFLIFDEDEGQLQFKEDDLVVTPNQIDHSDTGSFYVSCFRDLIKNKNILGKKFPIYVV